jgi:hypothetical protein
MLFLKELKYRKLLFSMSYVFLLLSLMPNSYAHVLEETSAQIILRDGQAEIRVITDIDHLISALQSNQSWLLGDTSSVMPTELSASEKEEFIKSELAKGIDLTINKAVIGFDQIVLINKDDSSDDEIIFLAQHPFSEVNQLSVSFHKSLGDVHVNVVKPIYKLLESGKSGAFSF